MKVTPTTVPREACRRSPSSSSTSSASALFVAAALSIILQVGVVDAVDDDPTSPVPPRSAASPNLNLLESSKASTSTPAIGGEEVPPVDNQSANDGRGGGAVALDTPPAYLEEAVEGDSIANSNLQLGENNIVNVEGGNDREEPSYPGISKADKYIRKRGQQKQPQPQEINGIVSLEPFDRQRDGGIIEQPEENLASTQLYHSSQSEYEAYMNWCHKVLGIQSVVEIKEFEYTDRLQMHWDEGAWKAAAEADARREFGWLKKYTGANDDDNSADGGADDGDADGQLVDAAADASAEQPTMIVRGLAAKHDIQVGDVVISVPLYSLLSVPTTIDHDPILSRILGPSARDEYGWTDATEYELPLLVLALLHHRSLGGDSPVARYVDMLMGTPVDSFPFLWSDAELMRKTGEGGEGVRTIARRLRTDLRELYDDVMGTLVRKRPEWFAPPSFNGDSAAMGESGESEWIYSYENFEWAFAMVISRHHYLPIQDFDEEGDGRRTSPSQQNVQTASPSHMQETISTVSEIVPPANQPTDSWVDLAKNEEHVVEDDLVTLDYDILLAQQSPDGASPKHSFLAPLADMINFGPPCLTGSFNAEEHTFDLIAKCAFTEGQEVTFYYSSDCADEMIANFGFLHPLMPPCDPPVDWEKKSEEWRKTAKMQEHELWEVYRNMDLLKEEMAALESQLVSCGCKDEGETLPNTSEGASSTEGKIEKRIRGRQTNEQAQINEEMMEELG